MLGKRLFARVLAACAVVIASVVLLAGSALAQKPIKIGFGMDLTGPLAANGKSATIVNDGIAEYLAGKPDRFVALG